jgi:hypothetical protein
VALSSFPSARALAGFDRLELTRILDLYGRMVAAGLWRDYAMNFTRMPPVSALFSARRSVRRPASRNALPCGKQGMWTLFGERAGSAEARA